MEIKREDILSHPRAKEASKLGLREAVKVYREIIRELKARGEK